MVAITSPSTTFAQRPGHMPASVPGHIVRQLLEFTLLPAFFPDSQAVEVYLDPVPEGFLRLPLPAGVRPAAALRNWGRVA